MGMKPRHYKKPNTIQHNMTRLGQRWLRVVSSVGPTFDDTLGHLHFAHRAIVRPKCWVNVGPTLQVFSYSVLPMLRQHIWLIIVDAKT